MITEALLEMHFHRAIVERFSHIFGTSFLRLLKPSPRQEAWVGFDQGWVHTALTPEEFLSDLRVAIGTQSDSVDRFYLGFFLQFKKVAIISRKRKYYPPRYSSPFYRVTLDLVPNEITRLSQHETLLRLRNIRNAFVAYACPMFFELDDIYQPVDLNQLRIKTLQDAPNGWEPNSEHFICYQTQDDTHPMWLSKPIDGKAYSFEEWALGKAEKDSPQKLNAKQLHDLIEELFEIEPLIRGKYFLKKGLNKYMKYLPSSMTVIEFKKNTKYDASYTQRRKFSFDD